MKNTFKKSYRLEGASYLSLSVYTTGIQKCEPLHQWGPGIRNHYLIHHIVSGKGYYKVNDNIWELHAGDTFLAFPYSEITYYADQKDPWEYFIPMALPATIALSCSMGVIMEKPPDK